MQIRTVERLLTRYFLPVTVCFVLGGIGVFAAAVGLGVPLENLGKVVDIVVKVTAVVVGTAWTLNRYFTARTDVLQLKVDPFVQTVVAEGGARLFLCRLDVVNTAKALTPPFTEVLNLQAVRVIENEVSYDAFYAWPAQQPHPVGPIEPGSWSAVSVAVLLPHEVHVVQVFLELQFESGDVWTWHRHFAAEVSQ